MEFFTTLKKLWFPSKETIAKLNELNEVYDAKLAPQKALLNKYKAAVNTTLRELNELEASIRSRSDRLNELEGCFAKKNALYESLNALISESKSTQSDLDSAYKEIKKNKLSKDDYYDWAGRQKSLWNGYSGRGGRKIRGSLDPMSLFNKYTRGDLERFKYNIASASSSIKQLKSKRSYISTRIELTKSDIFEVKKLCAYVKTSDGKKELRSHQKALSSLRTSYSELQLALESQEAKILDQSLAIKSIEKDWGDKKRRMKLA